MPFRDSYKISGKLVYLCTEKNCTLEDLSLTELKKLSPLFAPDVYEAIRLDTCVSQRKSSRRPCRRADKHADRRHGKVHRGPYKMNENARRHTVGGLILRIRRFRAPAFFREAGSSCS